MKTKVNEVTGVTEGFLQGKIVSINESEKQNAKKTVYHTAIVAITYPDGTTDNIQSVFYSAARTALPEVYTVGANIELAVQLDGEYAGNSVMQAPQRARIDLGKLGIEVAEKAPAITA